MSLKTGILRTTFTLTLQINTLCQIIEMVEGVVLVLRLLLVAQFFTQPISQVKCLHVIIRVNAVAMSTANTEILAFKVGVNFLLDP